MKRNQLIKKNAITLLEESLYRLKKMDQQDFDDQLERKITFKASSPHETLILELGVTE